ncbi:predicted protein [Sclerotinia sclerotiorum 1980 UF-70]|uniref:Uncharacterized protein n=1 Tax=Sclerotinia sclerotiorum (strain ATCC 18683 / 1980 / Ss-1) TaxID=665079 RepID=A7EBW0_SCLS1|nr:predicted protein [Sclerotinia sclerotiorum 1980 UF-70]EDN99938.1 predicted protein [Sclerotinia sclerotiorum 1980 UF-70]
MAISQHLRSVHTHGDNNNIPIPPHLDSLTNSTTSFGAKSIPGGFINGKVNVNGNVNFNTQRQGQGQGQSAASSFEGDWRMVVVVGVVLGLVGECEMENGFAFCGLVTGMDGYRWFGGLVWCWV